MGARAPEAAPPQGARSASGPFGWRSDEGDTPIRGGTYPEPVPTRRERPAARWSTFRSWGI